MYLYTALLQDLVERVRASFYRQVTDPAASDYGAFRTEHYGYTDGSLASHAADVVGAAYAFLVPSSPLEDDAELRDRLLLALKFQKEQQRQNGLIDLTATNWASPPDTAFVVQAFCPLLDAVRRKVLEGHDEIEPIASSLASFVTRAAEGIIGRGFHTPNHRWVICSALGQSLAYLDPPLRSRAKMYAQSLLAETLDVDEDGNFSERSTGLYNAIVCRSLVFIADHLERPDLLDAVRKILDFTLQLLHDDASLVTSMSTRVDRKRYVVPVGMADIYFDMAQRDGNGVWGRAADIFVQRATSAKWLAASSRFAQDQRHLWLLHPFLKSPLYREEALRREPLPDQFRTYLPSTKLWRVKRGSVSATAAANTPVPFSLQYGPVGLEVKLHSTYFGLHDITFGVAEVTERGIRLTHRSKRRPGYSLPLNRPVQISSVDEWRQLERDRWELPSFELELVIREAEGGFDLHLTSCGGLDGVGFQIECALQPAGVWETASHLTLAHGGQSSILRSGYGVYSIEGYAVKLGPGRCAHRTFQIYGSEPQDGFRVLLTYKSPLEQALRVRYGALSALTKSFETP